MHGFIIMINHLHLIASGDNLAREIGLFKSYTARQIVDCLTKYHYSGCQGNKILHETAKERPRLSGLGGRISSQIDHEFHDVAAETSISAL